MAIAKVKGMTLLVGEKAIFKCINEVLLKGAEYDNLLHLGACSVLAHIAKHHEVTLADKLCNAVGKAVKKDNLISWLTCFGSMTYNKELKCFAPAFKDTDQAGAEAKPFWEFKAPPAYQIVDCTVAAAVILKNAEKRLKERMADPVKTAALDAERLAAGLKIDNVTPELIAMLKALVNAPTAAAQAHNATLVEEEVEADPLTA